MANDGTCVCDQGFNFIEEKGECFRCSDECAQCEEANNITCSECAAGFYKQPLNRICLNYCPTGFVANDDTKECDNNVGEVFCQAFDQAFDQLDIIYDIAIENTSTTVSIQAGTEAGTDDHDPRPAYNRGMWFDGVDDMMKVTNLVLNTSFTVKYWVLVKANGVIFSINRQQHT